MTPVDAWEALLLGHCQDDAVLVVRQLVTTAAKRVSGQHVDDAAADVVEKLCTLVRSNNLPGGVADPEKYVYSMVFNRTVDLHRRLQRRPLSQPRPVPPHPRDFIDELAAELVPVALGLREEEYRDHAERAWEEICQLTEGRSLHKLLAAEVMQSGDAVEQVAARAYKRHERFRRLLVEAVPYLLRSTCSGTVPADERLRYEWMIAGLRRRRTRAWYAGPLSWGSRRMRSKKEAS